MNNDTDAEFLDSMEQWVIGSLVFKKEHRERLFALARRGAAMQWRPIETAPRNMGMLNYFPTYGQPIEVRHFKGHTATHWMPLPPPPAGEMNE